MSDSGYWNSWFLKLALTESEYQRWVACATFLLFPILHTAIGLYIRLYIVVSSGCDDVKKQKGEEGVSLLMTCASHLTDCFIPVLPLFYTAL